MMKHIIYAGGCFLGAWLSTAFVAIVVWTITWPFGTLANAALLLGFDPAHAWLVPVIFVLAFFFLFMTISYGDDYANKQPRGGL